MFNLETLDTFIVKWIFFQKRKKYDQKRINYAYNEFSYLTL